MKNYWGNWILSSTLIFVCISFLLVTIWSPLLVSARRTRSSRHHKPKHVEYKEDAESTTQLSYSESNNDSTSISPSVLKSEKIQAESYDVCQGWWCGHGRECQRGSDGLPSCICMRECPNKPPAAPSTSSSTSSTKNIKNREGNPNGNTDGYLEYGKGFEEFYEPFPGSELIFPPDAVSVKLNEFKPVCASNGQIFPSVCELYRTACIINDNYLHVDESEQSCRHVVGQEGEAGGKQNPALPPSYGSGGVGIGNGVGKGRDQGAGKRGSGGRGGSTGAAPGGGGSGIPNTGNRVNPFGESPSFLSPDGEGEFPYFSSGNIPSYGGVDIPFSNGREGFGQSDFPGNFGGGNVGGDEVDKFIPPKSGHRTNRPVYGRHNEEDRAKDGARSHGKLLSNTKSTGFGSSGAKAAAQAAAVTFPKWALPKSSFKNQFNMDLEDISDEEDDDEEEEDEEEDDDDEESEFDEDNENHDSELRGNSFINENELSLLQDPDDAAREDFPQFSKVASTASLELRPSGNGEQEMDGISKTTNTKRKSGKRSNLKHNRNVGLTQEENENEARKGQKKNERKKKRKITTTKKAQGRRGSEMKPSENRWDVADDEDDKVYGNDAPLITSAHSTLGREEMKPDGSKTMDDLTWKIDSLINKNRKSASGKTAVAGEDENDDDGKAFLPSQKSQKEGLDRNSVGNAESGKSDGKTFLSGALRGSSLCSREEYEILKDALLIYNHRHLIGDNKKEKKRIKSKNGGRKHSSSYRLEGRHRNDNDEEDEEKVEQSADDDNDNDVENDSNEEEENEDGDAGMENARQQERFAGLSHKEKRRFGYEDETTFEKEYLLSLMFAHFDQNNNGKLDYAELQKVGLEQKIERPATIHCHLVDFLRFDDMDHDNLISPNEFYAAFSKLYSFSILGIRKPRSPIYLTARVGEMLEIKCSVGAGSVTTVPGGERRRRKVDDGTASFPNINDNEEDENGDNDVTGNERGDELDYNNDAVDEKNNNDGDERQRNMRKYSSMISSSPSSTSSPGFLKTQWFRYGVDVSKLINLGEQFQIHKDGTLLITKVELIHAGNYSCHDDRGNEKVIQPYVLAVQMAPDVMVRPHIKWERPGQDVSMSCRVQGEPLPAVRWLKNNNPVIPSKNNKYTIDGDGITLKIKDINFSDTGAYMCQAQNEAGKRIDISSLVVIDEQALPPVQYNESQFLVFHERGISTYDPENCRLQHQILASDIIPGTQRDYICGSSSCEWGRALRVSSVYVYVSQPKLNRVLIISISQMVVVDVVSTDRLPVELHYVPQVDQVWIECWKEEEPYTTKTLQVIRGAKEKKKHRAVRPKPLVSLDADLVQNVFLPPPYSPFISLSTASSPPSPPFFHAYISHKNTRGLYKMDLRTLRYTKSIDLTSYNCLPEQVHFTALYGFVILECKEPVLHQPTGQLVLDSISDAIISYKADLNGPSFLSPDSRTLVTMVQSRHDSSGGTTLLQQHVEANGLRVAFDVNTSLNISDIAFFPSQRFHSYDLYATVNCCKEDVLFVDLHSGNVELVPGVGRALQNPSWERTQRPIASEDLFGKYLVSPSSDAVYVVNGRSHTVNCQIGGMTKPSLVVWL